MDSKLADIHAHLVHGDETYSIDAKYSSENLILVRFLNGVEFKNKTEFSKLVIHDNGEQIEAGCCRFLLEPNTDGYAGRLVLGEDKNFYNLLLQHRSMKIKSHFSNLSLIFAHKNKIKSSFKEYTANLTYDLNVYKNVFDTIDYEYCNEPVHIKDSIQKTIIDSEGIKFNHFLDKKIIDLDNVVRNFSQEDHKYHGYYFRKQIWHLTSCAPFMRRANLKPRGYIGDSKMMQMVYQNDYQGKTTFSKLLHKHPLKYPTAQAVRNRRTLIAGMLAELQKKLTCSKSERVKVLSIACGPAYEIQDLVMAANLDHFEFTMLDQDQRALQEAANTIDQIKKETGTEIKVEYLSESVRTMLASRQLKEK